MVKRFVVTIEVDEEKVKDSATGGAESTEEAVREEFEWLQQSGIHLVEIKDELTH